MGLVGTYKWRLRDEIGRWERHVRMVLVLGIVEMNTMTTRLR